MNLLFSIHISLGVLNIYILHYKLVDFIYFNNTYSNRYMHEASNDVLKDRMTNAGPPAKCQAMAYHHATGLSRESKG